MGMILGTAAYMAPEQVRGKTVDRRADIWAFGAVLYEMLSGRRAFQGEDTSTTLASVLKEDVRWDALPRNLPTSIDHLLRRCLERDLRKRLQAIGEARIVLEDVLNGAPTQSGAPPTVARGRSRERLAWAIAALCGVGALAAGPLAVAHLREAATASSAVQFGVLPEANSSLGQSATAQFVISPDGRQLVFVAFTKGVPMLWVRAFASLAARALPGTEGAVLPFWSPDGQTIGFFAGGKLRKVQAAGGPPAIVCDAGSGGGGTWNRDNVIVFSPSTLGPLYKVDAAGGTSTSITTLGHDEIGHRYPTFLPDDQHVLFLVAQPAARELRVAALGSTETTSLGTADSNAFYAAGHLLFLRNGALTAQPFELATLQRTGNPFPLIDEVAISATNRALLTASGNALAYIGGGSFAMSRLTWMDRGGKTLSTVGDFGPYFNLSLSPNERRVAVSMISGTPANRDIWTLDLNRADTATRLTFDPANEADPIWSPDGSQVLFNSNRNGFYNSAFEHRADGGGPDVPVVKTEQLFDSPDWSHDGQALVFTGGTQANRDLWLLPLSGGRTPAAFLQTPYNEECPAFSPDDRWIAYDSDASGRFEVYVQSRTPGGGQLKISRNGGWAPRWRGDGKEIFFLAPDGTMMAADVALGTSVQAGVPRALFPTTMTRTADKHTYAVTSDGQRFLWAVPDPRQASVPITTVLNWPALVKK
jgi:eukaryotic-like serine/threonine-protein kinase